MPVRGERAARLQQLPHACAACEDGGGQGHAAVLRRAGPRAAWLAATRVPVHMGGVSSLLMAFLTSHMAP